MVTIKTKNTGYKVVELPNGSTAVSLMPEQKGIAAIVDLETIKRLASLLKDTDLKGAKDKLIERILDTKTWKEYDQVLASEVAFQSTINTLTTVNVEEVREYLSELEDSPIKEKDIDNLMA